MLNPLRSWAPSVALLTLTPLASAQADFGELTQRANEFFGLESSQLQVVPMLEQPGTVQALVQIGSEHVMLDLEHHSVLAPDFKLWAQVEDGSLEAVTPAPESTFRGEVVGMPGSKVAGSLHDDGLYARIILPGDNEFWLEPIMGRVEGASPRQHVLYQANDVLESSHTCAAEALRPVQIPDATPGAFSGTALNVAELGCDADFEYYQDYGSSTSNVQNRITSIINTMNLQYESEVQITHQITTIIVRTSSNDPYTTNDAGGLLNQFRNEWLQNQGGVQRDVAHLFTGRNLAGSTIGIAWLNAVCSSFGFGLVESDFSGAFVCVTDLSAHELGHNWGADHCGCQSFTMNSFITCANQFNPNATIPDIISFRNAINCLSIDNPIDPPVAAFFGTPLTGEAPLTVNFTSQASGQVDSHLWFFDILDSSTATNPQYTFTEPGTYFISLEVVGPGGSDSEFKSDYITVTPPTGGNEGTYYVSFLTTTNLPGVGNVRDEDIAAYDVQTDTWSRFFDGSDVGVTGDVNALHVSDDGSILMSFNQPIDIPGLTGGPNGISIDDSDVVRFTPTSTGGNTSGSFEFVFDGLGRRPDLERRGHRRYLRVPGR